MPIRAADFKSAVYAIPPPGHTRILPPSPPAASVAPYLFSAGGIYRYAGYGSRVAFLQERDRTSGTMPECLKIERDLEASI